MPRNGYAAQLNRRVGACLRRYRQQAGLSQERLAQVLGVSFQQVQKYENGSNRVSAGALYLAARALARRLDEFFPDGAAPPGPEPRRYDFETAKALADLAALDPNARRLAGALVRAVRRESKA